MKHPVIDLIENTPYFVQHGLDIKLLVFKACQFVGNVGFVELVFEDHKAEQYKWNANILFDESEFRIVPVESDYNRPAIGDSNNG